MTCFNLTGEEENMKKKIVGIFVCTLLIVTILPVTGTHDEKTISITREIEFIPILDFVEIDGSLLGISVVLANLGEGTADNIYWEMNASGGLFFYPKSKNGTIDALYSDQSETIKIWPVLGLGITTITFYCKYKIVNLSYDVYFEVKQEWRNLALLFLHSFPETIQLTKEWIEIDNYAYFDIGVELLKAGINNMHNVRVVLDDSLEPEFLAACKFTDGIGFLNEYGITKELVTSGYAHWEVELVDGE